MLKKGIGSNLLIIFILAILGLNFVYPKYLNQGIDSFNGFQFSILNSELRLSHFPEVDFKLGLDLQGGSHLVYEADLLKIEASGKSSAMQGLRDVIERRVNRFGVGEPIVRIQEQGEHRRLIVELPGIKDVGEAIRAIGKTPYLEFKEQMTEQESRAVLDGYEEFQGKSLEEITQIPNWQNILREDPYFKSTILTGQYLEKAEVSFDQTTFEAEVLLQFDDEGKDIFKELTSSNIGKQLAIYIDDTLISAPVVREAIPNGKARITGNFTTEEAKDLARNLNAGALPVPIELISQKTIGPVLGQASLMKSLKAGMIGFLMVILFMILFYRVPGIFASLALIIYGCLVLSLFKLIPVTLTLAGIGGVILSVGMAVDANVLIFERIREELKTGKTVRTALNSGYERALVTVIDSNLTTVIAGVVLFLFGTGMIKGFGLTLTLGILANIFTAVFVTRSIFEFILFRFPIKRLSI